MAIEFRDENTLIIHVPNSEASVDAQHKGIKNTTVGSYYMSEMQTDVYKFLNNFNGDYYLDLAIILNNSKKIIQDLVDRNIQNAFKLQLVPQKSSIEFFEWLSCEESPLLKIPNPFVNENHKYLKFDNSNQGVENFRTLCLGDIFDIYIKRLGKNGYLIYNVPNINYEKTINDKIMKWVKEQ